MLWSLVRLSLTVVFFGVAFYLYVESKLSHSPYVVCAGKSTPTEVRQCKNSVDLADSAGW